VAKQHPTFDFPRRLRLTQGREFLALRRNGVRESVGPLAVQGKRNDREHCRLGLSISRLAGTAVYRHSIKRRVREAFRLAQHELSRSTNGCGYDLLVSARSHDVLPLEEYQRLLLQALSSIHRRCQRKSERRTRPDE
jgi:ribonuclease P protein component